MQKTAYCSRNIHAGPGVDIGPIRLSAQMLRIMRMTTFLLLAVCLHLSARTRSQTITMTGKDVPLKTIFSVIEKQTGYLVWGKAEFLEAARPVTIAAHNMPLSDFLAKTLKDQPFTYKITDNTFILSERPHSDPVPPTDRIARTVPPINFTIAGFMVTFITALLNTTVPKIMAALKTRSEPPVRTALRYAAKF